MKTHQIVHINPSEDLIISKFVEQLHLDQMLQLTLVQRNFNEIIIYDHLFQSLKLFPQIVSSVYRWLHLIVSHEIDTQTIHS